MTPGIPLEIAIKLRDFLASGKTGNVRLDIKDGRILAWQITENGRLCVSQRQPLDNKVESAIT